MLSRRLPPWYLAALAIFYAAFTVVAVIVGIVDGWTQARVLHVVLLAVLTMVSLGARLRRLDKQRAHRARTSPAQE